MHGLPTQTWGRTVILDGVLATLGRASLRYGFAGVACIRSDSAFLNPSSPAASPL